MKINCGWEHNGNNSLLYSSNIVGAFTTGASKEEAVEKMPAEIVSFMEWSGYPVSSPLTLDIAIVQEKESDLKIYDADSDVLFETECLVLSVDDYTKQRDLVMKSA